jgi:hypothetical protein
LRDQKARQNGYLLSLRKASRLFMKLYLVRMKRLELLHLAALEPKSSVSTNSTTSALEAFKAKAPDY